MLGLLLLLGSRKGLLLAGLLLAGLRLEVGRAVVETVVGLVAGNGALALESGRARVGARDGRRHGVGREAEGLLARQVAEQLVGGHRRRVLLGGGARRRAWRARRAHLGGGGRGCSRRSRQSRRRAPVGRH